MHRSFETSSGNVYLGYSQTELDRAYTQTEWAANIEEILQRWDERGVRCRNEGFGYAEHAYGAAGQERLDIFEASGPTLHFHIHGGAWQRQSKEACSFIAQAMQSIDVPFVVPEFGRLPDARMPEVLDQIAQALIWTYETCVARGRANDIVISGHSSGAHMAALLASYDFGDALPASCLRAVLCLSGSYDLHPVLLSSRRHYIDLTSEEAQRLSPIHRIEQMHVPLHLLYGERESPEFCRQSQAFAKALEQSGKLSACQEISGVNHFEIADDLGNLNTRVGQYAAQLLTTKKPTTVSSPQSHDALKTEQHLNLGDA